MTEQIEYPLDYDDELLRILKYDEDTYQHGLRVGYSAYRLMLKLTDNEYKANMIRRAGELHDIGKLYIPKEILYKSGRITDDERKQIEEHSNFGYQHVIGKPEEFYRVISQGVLEHHERYDGTGYPRRLYGEEISLCGRIIAICDVNDALRSERSYKRAWTYRETKEYMLDNSGVLFDPRLVNLFFEDDTCTLQY